MSTKAASPLFLFLVRDPASGDPEPTSAEIEKMFEWFRDLKKKGHLVAIHPLVKPGSKLVRGTAARQVTDGPFAEAKEVVGGYMIVKARNLTQAVALAKGFPVYHLRRSVEVRRLVTIPEFS